MKHFLGEQESTSQPPEPRGEKTPEEGPKQEEDAFGWDGSEAELVADETAELFEEQHTGIKLKYVLTRAEVFRALLKVRYTTSRIALSVIGVLLSAGLMVYFLLQLQVTKNADYSYFSFVSALMLFLIGVVPLLKIQREAAQAANGQEVKMKIYPDFIEMGHGTQKWEIPLDGNTERVVLQKIFILYINEKNMVILPLRCVEPGVLPEVQAMLLAGTRPAE